MGLTIQEKWERLHPEQRRMVLAAKEARERALLREAEARMSRDVMKRLLYQLRADGVSLRVIAYGMGLSPGHVDRLTERYRPKKWTKTAEPAAGSPTPLGSETEGTELGTEGAASP